jgi:tetratricopeptide (TPR) repeat protein
MAGTSVTCKCGRTIPLLTLDEKRQDPIAITVPSSITEALPPHKPRARSEPLAEMLAPMTVWLQVETAARQNRRRPVMATVTMEALWIQDTYELRRLPLQSLNVEMRRKGKELALTVGPEPDTARLILTTPSYALGEHWCEVIKARKQLLGTDPPNPDRHLPEGVALVWQAPKVAYEVLGRVEYTDHTAWAADRGLQLQAGILGADAVISVNRSKCTTMGAPARNVMGLAVRVEDPAARERMRTCWFAEEVSAVVKRMLLILVLQAVLVFVANVFCAGRSAFISATGETEAEAMASVATWMGVFFGWPLVLLALLRLLRWPGLLRAAGLAVLAATTGRGLALWLSHLAAVCTAGVGPGQGKVWLLADPVDWAVIIWGAFLCARSWRLARDAQQILPPKAPNLSPAREKWAHGMLAVSAGYALAFLGFAAVARYQESSYLIQPGIDPRREHQALLAFNEGLAQSDKGELRAAEQSWLRSLRIWEDLTRQPRVPSLYRVNLARAVYGLGWLCHRQNRLEEAEKHYARAVALADELGDDPQADADFRATMAEGRHALVGLRNARETRQLIGKGEQAARKYEEAQLKASKEDIEAEGLFREAIALWEEILPKAENEEYRRATVARVATAYLFLGQLQQQMGKHAQAETTLKKAIEQGEKAVAFQPDQQVLQHNLEVARRMLDEVRTRAAKKNKGDKR